jgi:hypothetical protein
MFPQASAQFRHERELSQFPDLNVVRFARYEALGTFAGIPELAALRAHRAFAYSVPRGRGARMCLLAGRETDAIIDAITKLASLAVLPLNGCSSRWSDGHT